MCACDECSKKTHLKRLAVYQSPNGEYIQPMKCKKCGYMSEISVVEWIKSRKGNDVNFKPPAQRKGTLEDRAVVESDNIHDRVYWDVVDLIKFDDPGRTDWIRLSYYLTDRNKMLIFGGQTSIAEPISVWKRILVKAARDKEWFRCLLEEVVREL